MADLWDCYGPPPATGSDDEAWSEHSNDQGTPDGGGCGRNGRGAGATSASRKRTRAQQLLLMRGLRPPGSVPLPPSPPPADDLERELLLLRDAAQQAANPSGGAAAPLRLSDSDDERSAAAAAKADVSLGLAQLSEAGRAAAAHARALERELSEAQTLAAGCASQEAEELPELPLPLPLITRTGPPALSSLQELLSDDDEQPQLLQQQQQEQQQPPGPPPLQLVFQLPSRARVKLPAQANAPLAAVLEALRSHAAEKGWPTPRSVVFDGDELSEQETPAALGLEDGDVLDVHVHAPGDAPAAK